MFEAVVKNLKKDYFNIELGKVSIKKKHFFYGIFHKGGGVYPFSIKINVFFHTVFWRESNWFQTIHKYEKMLKSF